MLQNKPVTQEKKKLEKKIPTHSQFMEEARRQMRLHKALLDKLKDA